MADDGLGADLQNGGFATLGKAANPASYGGVNKAANDAIGNVNSRIQDFYKKSRQALGMEKKAEPGMAPGTFEKFKTEYKKEHKGD